VHWRSRTPDCSSDPALEFSGDVNALTFFALQPTRGGADVVQATGLDLTYGSERPIRGYSLAQVTGAPAAMGLWDPFEGERRHNVIARTPDGNLYFTGTNGPVYP
jgi:hypothetical protein